jgi:MFS family permease
MNLLSARFFQARTETVRSAEISPRVAMIPVALTSVEMKRGRKMMNLEGSLWAVMNAVTAGTVVTAFALQLHADDFVIGLLSSLPLLAAMVQLWTPQLVARFGGRKRICLVTAALARTLWVPATLLAVAVWLWPGQYTLWLFLFLGLVTLFAAFTSIVGTAWLSWAGTVVPIEQRANYFARRSMLVGFIGLVASLLIGAFLDWWSEPTATGHQPHPGAYIVLFLVAAGFGIATVFVLRRTPDLVVTENVARPRLRDSLTSTWRHLALRRYLIFRAFWSFSVGLVVPYYTVYMLQNLKMSFTEIFILQNIGAAVGLFTLPLWGRIIEKHGCSRVMFWTSLIKVFYVIAWAFVTPGQPFWPLAVLHFTLLVDAGLNLAANNLLMNLMPDNRAGNIGYISAFTAITSVFTAGGPFLAGLLIGLIAQTQLTAFGFAFGALQLMFILSGILRLLSLGLFRGFKEM